MPKLEDITRIDTALLGLTKALIFRDRPPAALAELPLSQLRCVRVIGENEGAKMHDVAHQLFVTLPALSQIVDRLVRRDMVERHTDESDRRIVRLFLSASAREMFRQGREERLERIRVMLSQLSRDDTESGIRILERMALYAEQTRIRLESADGGHSADSGIAEASRTRADAQAAQLSPTPVEAGQ